MKRNILFLLLTVSLVFSMSSCNSCSEKSEDKKIEENEQSMLVKPQMNVTRDDSALVIDLVNLYFNYIQHKNYSGAMSMVYYLGPNKKLVAPPKALYNKELTAISQFPIYGYNIEYLKFYRETDSEVKYTIYLQDPKKVQKPATMSGMMRPVRVDGKWYLTLADAQSELSESELDNQDNQ